MSQPSPNWREEYSAALRAADAAAPVDNVLFTACSRLQDQVATLRADNERLKASATATAPDDDNALADPATSTNPADPIVSAITQAQLHVDLAEALRAKGSFRARLATAEAELETLRSKTILDTQAIRMVTAERNRLLVKVRDRDEELRGKLKLVEEVQDELIALNLQLNVAEQQRDRVKKENKELVDRWMQHKSQEAEAMNRANEPWMGKR